MQSYVPTSNMLSDNHSDQLIDFYINCGFFREPFVVVPQNGILYCTHGHQYKKIQFDLQQICNVYSDAMKRVKQPDTLHTKQKWVLVNTQHQNS